MNNLQQKILLLAKLNNYIVWKYCFVLASFKTRCDLLSEHNWCFCSLPSPHLRTKRKLSCPNICEWFFSTNRVVASLLSPKTQRRGLRVRLKALKKGRGGGGNVTYQELEMGSCDVEERALVYLGPVKRSELGFTLALPLDLGLLPNLAFTSKLGCLTK